jgi:hypothetical protein
MKYKPFSAGLILSLIFFFSGKINSDDFLYNTAIKNPPFYLLFI